MAFFSCYTYFFSTNPPKLLEQGMARGVCCESEWKGKTLKQKLGKALNPRPQKLMLSSADVVCM